MKKTAFDKEMNRLGSELSNNIKQIMEDPKAKEKLIADMAAFGDKDSFKEPPYS